MGAVQHKSWNFHDPDPRMNETEDEGRDQKSGGQSCSGCIPDVKEEGKQ